MTAPSLAQTQARPNDDVPVTDVQRVVERSGNDETPLAVANPLPVQKTRSLVARTTGTRIDFRIPWQTGIYQ